MRPKKYAQKLKLAPVSFEDTVRALLKVKPPEGKKKSTDSRAKPS